MIKYNHSDSVIAYYTRWYAVHSVPTLSLHHVTSNLVSYFYFLLKIMLGTISTSISEVQLWNLKCNNASYRILVCAVVGEYINC